MDWQCSGCGRHFSWMKTECPYCRHSQTITTGDTQPNTVATVNTHVINLLEDIAMYLRDNCTDGASCVTDLIRRIESIKKGL